MTAQFFSGRAYLRKGRWKLTAVDKPFDESVFALYDLQADPGETTDLSKHQPEKREELLELWRKKAVLSKRQAAQRLSQRLGILRNIAIHLGKVKVWVIVLQEGL